MKRDATSESFRLSGIRSSARAAASVAVTVFVFLALAGEVYRRFWPFPAPAVVTVVRSETLHDTIARVNEAFAARWSQLEIVPVGRASDLEIARRLSLSLVGTIPSLREIREFLQQPPGERLDWFVSRLLGDERFYDYFAERLGRSYAGAGFQPLILFRQDVFYDWLGGQLRDHRPYDETVRDMITAQGLWTDVPAVNFLTATSDVDSGAGPVKERLAGRVARGFLGANLDCAECHDHPFESWKQDDFRALAAFFGTARQGLSGIFDQAGDSARSADVPSPDVPFEKSLLAQDRPDRQALAAWVTDRGNSAFARATVNRIWNLLCGRPLMSPVDNLPVAGPFHPALEALAADFTAHDYSLDRLLRVIVATDAFRMASRAAPPLADLSQSQYDQWAAFPLTRLRTEQLARSIAQTGSLEPADFRQSFPNLRAAFTRVFPPGDMTEFVARFGDAGEKELLPANSSIAQKLIFMNGNLVRARTVVRARAASAQILLLAKDNSAAVDASYLVALSRLPTPPEREHFAARLRQANDTRETIEDIFWTLINSSEFSWNH